MGDEAHDHDTHEGSWVTRIGTLLGAGVVASLVSVVPASLRPSALGSVASAEASLAAVAAPFAIALVWLLRRARGGAHLVFAENRHARIGACVAWLGTMTPTFLLFALVLKRKTHHHGLAATTYALTVAAFGALLAFVLLRAFKVLSLRMREPRWLAMGAGAFALATSVGATLYVAASLLADERAIAGAWLVDTSALCLATLFVSRTSWTDAKWLARVGPPALLVLLLLGYRVLPHGSFDESPFYSVLAHTLSASP
jgi:hypothetical protein